MKRKTLNNKLELRKETIASLNTLEMQNIHGGDACPPTSVCITITILTWTQKPTGQTCTD